MNTFEILFSNQIASFFKLVIIFRAFSILNIYLIQNLLEIISSIPSCLLYRLRLDLRRLFILSICPHICVIILDMRLYIRNINFCNVSVEKRRLRNAWYKMSLWRFVSEIWLTFKRAVIKAFIVSVNSQVDKIISFKKRYWFWSTCTRQRMFLFIKILNEAHRWIYKRW